MQNENGDGKQNKSTTVQENSCGTTARCVEMSVLYLLFLDLRDGLGLSRGRGCGALFGMPAGTPRGNHIYNNKYIHIITTYIYNYNIYI